MHLNKYNVQRKRAEFVIENGLHTDNNYFNWRGIIQVEQSVINSGGVSESGLGALGDSADLVMIFGGRSVLEDQKRIADIKALYPNAYLTGCSTAGEICGTQVLDDSLVVTAIKFDHTTLKGAMTKIEDGSDSFDIGSRLANKLEKDGLTHMFVLSDGLNVNGSELVRGLTENLPSSVSVTGGLSGDGANFQKTLVVWDDAAEEGSITAIGFYGDRLKIGYGSLGGWDAFGPERLITRSENNILYELDGKSALDLYKTYLGDHAQGLPATGLLFPLSVRFKEGETPVVRTILAVNEEDQSMTFAGDVPKGSYARFMSANFTRLIDGAGGAAQTSYEAIGSSTPDLAILISCVGRKMVLLQRTEEEVEAVREILGDATVLTGFYSYGEISPFTPGAKCALHNQTMTITTFSEK